MIVLYPPHVETDGFGADFAERCVDFYILVDGPFLVLLNDREKLTPVSDFGSGKTIHHSTGQVALRGGCFRQIIIIQITSVRKQDKVTSWYGNNHARFAESENEAPIQ